MSTTLPAFRAPSWADPHRSSAHEGLSGSSVSWNSANLSTRADLDVQLNQWQHHEPDDGTTRDQLELEIRLPLGGDLFLPSIDHARALLDALTTALPLWEEALAEGGEGR